MAFADDLLDQAYHLVNRERKHPKQASLRRAVSTAYYAVFHRLIDDAVSQWSVARQRGVLARIFDHARMKKVCEDYVKHHYSSRQPSSGVQLMRVAKTFITLQEQRLIADYDTASVWDRATALKQCDLAKAAFADWTSISHTDEAKDFLLALFLPKRRD